MILRCKHYFYHRLINLQVVQKKMMTAVDIGKFCSEFSLYVITVSTIWTHSPFLTRAQSIRVTCFTNWRTEKGTALNVITSWESEITKNLLLPLNINKLSDQCKKMSVQYRNISHNWYSVFQFNHLHNRFSTFHLKGYRLYHFWQWLLQVSQQFIFKKFHYSKFT